MVHRRKLPVLSEPLEADGPLVAAGPGAGFWFIPLPLPLPEHWGLAGPTPMFWFLVGLFYAVMAVARRSSLCTVLAVLTSNLGLWVLLHQSHVAFLHHPQLWLIPLGLGGLVAQYVHRDRLSEPQSRALRYLALGTIYISSTADMFIAGLGNSWGLPLV